MGQPFEHGKATMLSSVWAATKGFFARKWCDLVPINGATSLVF
jgi:hypothetical protein